MKTLEKISDFVGKYMAIIVLVIAAMALFVPTSLSWVKTSWVNYLLMVVMFGMGLTIKPDELLIVFKQPKNVIIGCLSQFTIMPLLAFALGKLFKIDDALLVGLVLVGTCSGGTSSNVMSWFSYVLAGILTLNFHSFSGVCLEALNIGAEGYSIKVASFVTA